MNALRDKELSNSAKIAAAQKVIKNKFFNAYTNRVSHEKNVNETIKPMSRRNRTTTTATTTKETSKFFDCNALCIRLQKLIESQAKGSGKKNYSREIELIISKLREMEIIV